VIPLKDDNPTSSTPIITYFLIGACVVIFLLELSSPNYDSGAIFYSWGFIPASFFHNFEVPSEVYRVTPMATLFTSMFMHGGFMHLIGNMLYMWIFADNIEDELGKFKFIIFYISCGIFAGLCQALIDVNSEIPMIGASGAISGILGAYLILFPKKDIKVFFWFFIFIKIFRIPAMFVIGGWIFIQFFSLNSSEESNVAYLAHIGGFIAGIILIIIFRKKISKQSKRLTKGSLPNSD